MQSAIQIQSLRFTDRAAYIKALIFIAGNVALPQLCHLISMGGPTWLPIYFFTLIGAYMYGWRVGVITALVSPIVNALFFAMPTAAVLPAILLKSTLLAVIAGTVATRTRRADMLTLCGVVLGYQVLGTLGEWAMLGNLYLACQDFRIGIPGMLTQIIGGWAVINRLCRK